MIKNGEIIQQWQYLGKLHPRLLEDKIFEYSKRIGITSLQSYVSWAEIEKEPGKFDFSSYDALVEKIKKHNLKWVPFFILGPNYATPKWFQESKESLFAKCLEHKKKSKIQSIWNPFLSKWVDRFLRVLSEHFQDKNVLESICLGISGNWGEAIYPVQGDFYQNFHCHPGWWCGDKEAIKSFRKYALEKYGSLDKVNDAWETNFPKIELIDFPDLRYYFSLSREIYRFFPRFLKSFVKFIYNYLKKVFRKETKNIRGKQQWLDFTAWYTSSMTNWAEFWLERARKYFPENEIYLVTGGNNNPILGADFSAQAKLVAKHNGGIRITNQTADYPRSFALTRLISSASRFYGSYFTTEEGQINQPETLTMRIFDTLTSGAKGFYCKNIIGTGKDYCSKKIFPLAEPTRGAEILAENLSHFSLSKPIVKAAVFFPSVSIVLEPLILDSLYGKFAKLRNQLDFDLLDENMIKDDALKNYQFFAILEGKPFGKEELRKIEEWIEAGGIFISPKSLRIFPEENESLRKIGQGYLLFYPAKKQNYLKFIGEVIHNQAKTYPWQGIPKISDGLKGVYATRFSDKIIYFNANNFEVRKKVGSKKIKANSILVEKYNKKYASFNCLS